MNKEEIQQVLPHREPMLLIEKTSLDADGNAHAWATIPSDAFYCQGHFPGNPVVPGVILCEMMAQSTCQLFPEVFKDHLLVYRGMDNVKFRGMVKPGDVCEIVTGLVEQKGSLYVCDSKVLVDGRCCAQGRITVAATPKQS
jgi:3-hydroxyacyl-[acyl-carrier-protein] dehydratase